MLDSGTLTAVRELVEAGHIRPVLDRCYPLEEMSEAHRYVQQGHKRGGVAVTVDRGRTAGDPSRRYFTPWNAFHAGFLFPLRSMSPV